ncbi:MAG: ABC transporter ATP-binding protein [Nitrospirales bacterium]|nr:ABC transporter ATP-binding protein [Nitrospirales bacterium]
MELKVTGINKSFRSTAGEEKVEILHDISFTVREGSFVSIIGPSGCGKTTLLRIISGIESPDNGRVLLGDREISAPVRDVGYIFQESALLPWRTVQKNIEFGLEVAGVGRKEREQRALASLELVELKGFGGYYPREISGGMKQKVALAMALVVEPRVLLMDEPFVSLDCQTRSYLQQVLLHVWEKTGKTVIFITHNVEEAVFLGDEIICLTGRPTVVGTVVPVDIPRPRERTSPELNRVRREILLFLEEERQKAGAR